MTEEDLKKRTKLFAVRTFRFIQKMEPVNGSRNIGWQLIDCSSSVAANYRAVCMGKSRRDFVHKLRIVLEEADESAFWLEFIKESGIHNDMIELSALHKEATELTKIFIASIKTTERNQSSDTKYKM
ncbi:MAG TPA: four helix bundle protein [Bacteroidia bacterium]|nr:four helix bundle protein [Bacteroidia bacterium]